MSAVVHQASNRRERRAHARQAERAERWQQAPLARAKQSPPKLADAAPSSLSGPQTICLSAIMRENDPGVVERCLVSVRPFICAWRIADSGCSDEVRATIHRVLDGIPGELIPIEWSGFADARNVALDAARATGCDFALIADADDYIEPSSAALSPLAAIGRDFGAIESHLGEKKFFRLALARLPTAGRWQGAVHERLIPPGVVSERIDGYRMQCTRDGAASRAGAEAKARHYRDLLLAEARTEENNALAWYHLADAQISVRDYPAALRAFERALSLEPTGYIGYACHVRCADVMARLGAPTGAIAAVYAAAIAQCPDRAEAPRWLAHLLTSRGEQQDRARELHAFADTLLLPASVGWVDFKSYKEHR